MSAYWRTITLYKTLRDARVQNAIVAELRDLPQAEVGDAIVALMGVDDVSALRIARRVLRGKGGDERVLRHGLATANRSTVRSYIDYGKLRLGLPRTLRILEDAVASNAEALEGAVYWLPRDARTDEERASVREAIARLKVPA